MRGFGVGLNNDDMTMMKMIWKVLLMRRMIWGKMEMMDEDEWWGDSETWWVKWWWKMMMQNWIGWMIKWWMNNGWTNYAPDPPTTITCCHAPCNYCNPDSLGPTIHMSNEKHPGCLGYIGDYTTYLDLSLNHSKCCYIAYNCQMRIVWLQLMKQNT